MLQKVKQFIDDEHLCDAEDTLLTGVSGGIDSMVMLDVLSKLGYNCKVAHCHFSLRGEEADHDRTFIEQEAGNKAIPFYTKQFDTIKHAETHHISIQMAARDLRYDWFEELRREQNCQWIAVAHNQDDQAETMISNLIRGTGIRGFGGMYPKRQNIIRPLLHCTREEIIRYAEKANILYREDASNASVKYKRNFIRHEIIPRMQELNPNLSETLYKDAEKVRQTIQLTNQQIQQYKKYLLNQPETGTYSINIKELLLSGQVELISHELLKDFGFSPEQNEQIARYIKNNTPQSGKKFISDEFLLVFNRKEMIITPNISTGEKNKHYIDSIPCHINQPVEVDFKMIPYNPQLNIPKDSTIALLDYDKIELPLILRKWQEGDRFFPLGMDNPKKISDFFIDQKIPLHHKQKVWLLLSGKEIIWVMGHRISEHYKITNQTKTILQIQMNPH